MDVPDATGLTARRQLLAILKKTGIRPAALDDEPELSQNELSFIRVFWKVRRGSGGGITIGSIKDWSEAFDYPISPIEIDYIFMLDNVIETELSKRKAE